MPPGRPSHPVHFFARLPSDINRTDVDKVTLRWSLDDWKRDFELHLATTSDLLDEYEITLYPLKDGSRVEYKYIAWKGDVACWFLDLSAKSCKTPQGFLNNWIWPSDD